MSCSFEAKERDPDRPYPVLVNDETLRDGLQNPSVVDPPPEEKVELLHLMEELEIEHACVGFPGAGPRQFEAAERLCREISTRRLRIRPGCVGRTHSSDLIAALELEQRTGVALELSLFLGCSPIRRYVEGWSLAELVKRIHDTVTFAVQQGADVMFVTEDATRSAPQALRSLHTAAVEAGAKRISLCDTVGCAMPAGVTRLVHWTRELMDELGVDVGIDWHGHRDRGLGLANSLAAAEAGATRIHATALGVGERVGNTAMEQVLVNLKRIGLRDANLRPLNTYTARAARALGVAIPSNQPFVGRDVLRFASQQDAATLRRASAPAEATRENECARF